MPSYGDNPLRSSGDDRLGRRPGARSLARDIRDADASEGFVMGIVGPWGSGKTSILTMIREELAEDPAFVTIDFNPWVFSGTNDLIESFFTELSAELRVTKDERLGAIAETIDTYGDILSPVTLLPFIGGWLQRVRGTSKAYAELQKKRSGGVNQQRDKVSQKLAVLTSPIVVFIDDIDRLESSEIRDIFKLVRLTASFPNIVYVLAFDRARVEEALNQSGFDGRAYLEKIVQLGADVPAVPDSVLLRQIGEVLEDSLNDLGVPERFDTEAWPDVLMEVIRPLIKNMRDVRRYAAAARSKARALEGQVELVDLLALEALRLFVPDLFQAIVRGRDGLTTPSSGHHGAKYEDPSLKQQVLDVVEAGSSHPEITRAAIQRLFPAGRRHIENNSYGAEWLKSWLKARRVAHADVLATYLEHVANDNMVAFSHAEGAFAVLNDEGALQQLLDSYDLDRQQDVIAALEAFEDDYPIDAVVPACRVLLRVLPRLPEKPRGMLTFTDARLIVDRVVLRLLRRIDGESEVMATVLQIIDGVGPLASQLEIVTLVGHREGAGHRLVSAADAQELEHQLQTRIEAASPDQLATEQNLVRLLNASGWWWGGAAIEVPADNPDLTKRILLDARSVVQSQQVGTRIVRRATRLQWDAMVGIFGGEENLRDAIDLIRHSSDEELDAAVQLADAYLTGWRPSEWEDD